MSGAARKTAYKRHEYSGVRKSSKRVKSAFKRLHGHEKRVEIWRSEEMKKKLNEQIIPDNSIVTQNTQPRTYAHVKTKIRLDTTDSVPSTSIVKAEPVNEKSVCAKQKVQNDIEVFCPKCNSKVSHTAEGIQLDQTKIIVAKAYHYFEQEYEELKKTFEGIDQTTLSMFRQRTALATGVSEAAVEEILEEEARRNEEMRQQTLREQGLAYKRPRQTDSSSETTAVQRDTKSYKRRKTKRNAEAPPVASAPPGTSTPPVISAPPNQRLNLLQNGEVKIEQL